MDGALQVKYRYSTWKSFRHRHQYMIARFSSSTKVNCFANRTMSYALVLGENKRIRRALTEKYCIDFAPPPPPPVLTSPLQKGAPLPPQLPTLPQWKGQGPAAAGPFHLSPTIPTAAGFRGNATGRRSAGACRSLPHRQRTDPL